MSHARKLAAVRRQTEAVRRMVAGRRAADEAFMARLLREIVAIAREGRR